MDRELRRSSTLGPPDDEPVRLNVSVDEIDVGTVRVRVGGELDVSTSGALQAELDRLVVTGQRTSIVLDLSDLSFLDSTGLRALWTARQHALSAGGTLVLEAPSDPVLRVLRMTRLDKVFMKSSDDEPSTSPKTGRKPPLRACGS